MATIATAVNDIRNSIATTTNGIQSSINNVTSTVNNIARTVNSAQTSLSNAANFAQNSINSAINMVNGVKNKIGDPSLFSSNSSGLGIGNGTTSLDQNTTVDNEKAQNPTYDLIGKPTNITPIQQISGGFSVMADPVSMAASIMGEKADSFLKPNYSLLGDLPGIDLPKNPFGDLLTKGKDGLAKLSDLANAPKAAIEAAKNSLLKGSDSLKASFNTLPNFMQKAILNESGVFDSGLMSARSITNSVGNFYNKAMSGDYVLNPKSLTRDINALTSFTSAAIKGGVANTLVNLVGGLGNNFGPIGSIITKVGAGMLVSKNSKGLAKLGISLNGNRNIMPISALKPAIVKTIFSGLKSDPKTKANDRGVLRTQAMQSASFFDRTTSSANTIPNVSSMVGASSDVRNSFSYALRDRSIAPIGLTREQLTNNPASRTQMVNMLNATDTSMTTAIDSTVALSPSNDSAISDISNSTDNINML